MPDLKEVDQALSQFIRPATFPLAIKMLMSEDEVPTFLSGADEDLAGGGGGVTWNA